MVLLLPAPFGPEQAEQFAGAEVEGQPVHGRERAVADDEILDADGRLAHGHRVIVRFRRATCKTRAGRV